METNEIREKFQSFFESKGHKRIPSGSLLLNNDPTLLFANAGMVPLKDYFLDPSSAPNKRVTSSQKCLRISGKHNDLENVGHSASHHTFFEMLGNFSFGDYFKSEAIEFAWELSLKQYGLEKDRIWVTIFEEDDEAEELWKKLTDIDPSRIVRLGAKENFWSMGDTGPCGPCSELHYYSGEDLSAQSKEAFIAEHPDYTEYYNLVFMQFDRQPSGEMKPLPNPCVDTGMGLERMARIKLGVSSNYDTQGLRDLVEFSAQKAGVKYVGKEFEKSDWKSDKQYIHDFALRVLADHGRAVAFLLAEGVQPGSEGRNYITRRLVRRAVRHARNLGILEPFLFEVCGKVADEYGKLYPELEAQREFTSRAIKAEEEKFIETLESGLKVLETERAKLKKGEALSGSVAFLLHDTYGFPLDLTEDALKPEGVAVDTEGFDAEMAKQRARSKQDRQKQGLVFETESFDLPATEFVGYTTEEQELSVSASVLFAENRGGKVLLIADKTPFYAESGGQVGDTGLIAVEGGELAVEDTQKTPAGQYLHICSAGRGLDISTLVGKEATLTVNVARRDAIRRNHSATHLLHSALRKVLGDHVRQAGSRVDETSLRFDYTHFEAPTPEQLSQIEEVMASEVQANSLVVTELMEIEAAKERGAMALFGEKYGAEVRVVQIGPNSLELCGGTHASRSGDLGGIIIVEEGSVAAGTRRIQCVRGVSALKELQRLRHLESESCARLKTTPDSLIERIDKMLESQRDLQRELANTKQKLTSQGLGDLLQGTEDLPNGVRLLVRELPGKNMNELREMIDVLRSKLESGAVILASSEDDKSVIAAGITKDLSKKVHIGNILKDALAECGGRGGGRDTFAQGGGVPQQQIGDFFSKVKDAIAANQ